MKIRLPERFHRPAGLVLAILVSLPAAGGAGEPPVEVPPGIEVAPTVWGIGEKMVFNLSYGPVSAGEGTLEVKGLVRHRGHVCYELESKANSNRFFSGFYKVRDKIVSFIDAETLYSRYFYKRLREGDYKKTVEIEFDHPGEEAHYTGGDSYPITEGVQDVLSAIYYARNLDLGVGDVYHMQAHSSRKTYDLKIKVHGKERVEVEAGTWDCYVVEPFLEGEGLFKHEGKVTMYISDDAHRIPVLVKTKVPVGSIDVELKSFTPGVPLVPLDVTGD
jgi:hypothetical protein